MKNNWLNLNHLLKNGYDSKTDYVSHLKEK